MLLLPLLKEIFNKYFLLQQTQKFVTNQIQILHHHILPQNNKEHKFHLNIDEKILSSLISMQSSKNNPYKGGLYENISMKSAITQSRTTIFDIDKLSQIDEIFVKNEAIYKNLRKKLQQISQSQKNITNNINVIRPISYTSKQKQLEMLQYEKYLYDTGYYEKNLNFDNYISSPIQTERFINESMKGQCDRENQNYLKGRQNANNNVSQQASLKQSNAKQLLQSTKFRRLNNEKYTVYDHFIRNTTSSVESDSNFINLTQTTNKTASHINLRENSSIAHDREKQNFYFMSKSFQPHIDSLVKMNFGELDKRKEQIQKIYDQLKQEEEQIQKSYQQYKKGFTSINQVSTNKSQQHVIKSPPKKSPHKKSFANRQQNDSIASKMSSITKIEDSSMNIKHTNLNTSAKTIQLNQIPENVQKNSFSPIQSSMIKYCTQEFECIDIPEKPQPMSARSHVFVPFNKLYKSPIIQMKNKNTLILARQSKLVIQKTAQQKIIDGKKYKFSQTVQTDEQQLIKNVLKQEHNMIAIVGGQSTLKKKLHMAVIAHSFEKIMKIINAKKYNCLTVSLSYQQYFEKSEKSSARINNTVEINEQRSTKSVTLQVQKIIENIYEAIKKTSHPNEPAGFNKVDNQANKDKIKIVRFTKLSLSSGKQCIWACNIMSANQFSLEFLKNLEIKDIIWSINPLIKNYDQVSKTLNEATRYIEARIHI